MAIINYANKEVQFKIVFYGPALCGKTTNLAYIHSQVNDVNKGELVSLATAADLDHLRRGDLLFWKGHVAIARDAATLIHANAFHMAVEIETIGEAVRRIKAAGSEVTSVQELASWLKYSTEDRRLPD